MHVHLSFGLCIAMIAGSSAVHAAEVDGALARRTLDACLASRGATRPPAATIAIPPGLSRNANVIVAGVPGADGRMFEYQGTAPRVLACGIAIYGPVSPATVAALRDDIDARRSQWMKQPPGPYALRDAVPGTSSYWGDLLAPSISGVQMIERTPSSAAPTLEIDFHVVLVP